MTINEAREFLKNNYDFIIEDEYAGAFQAYKGHLILSVSMEESQTNLGKSVAEIKALPTFITGRCYYISELPVGATVDGSDDTEICISFAYKDNSPSKGRHPDTLLFSAENVAKVIEFAEKVQDTMSKWASEPIKFTGIAPSWFDESYKGVE